MKRAGVVPIIRLSERLHEPLVDVGSIQMGLKPAVCLDTPVFGDSQEHHAVVGALHREVQLALRDVRGFELRCCTQIDRAKYSFSLSKASPTAAVPFLRLLFSAYLSNEVLNTASQENTDEIRSHFFSYSL